MSITSALISLSDYCTVGCKFCFRSDHGKYAMNKKLLARILSRLKEIGVTSICFTGGEPTDHDDFTDFCRIAIQFGFIPSVITSARTKNQVNTLSLASKFLGIVTISADCHNIVDAKESSRSILSACNVLQNISGPERYIHILFDEIESEDISILNSYLPAGVKIEISPVIRKNENLTICVSKFKKSLNKFEEEITLSENLYDKLTFLENFKIASECSKNKYYVSASGFLRFCPYHSENEVNLLNGRKEITDGIHSLASYSINKSVNCGIICGQ